MAQRNTQKLRSVSNFPDLVDYLRDDLDWPIEVEDAEEIVFEYDADELGIDSRYAVKINSIRQIRPLAEGQLWGVFYIDFESKKLPVVVLRRILRAFVSSTRSQQAERPVWDMNDLLFISAFGEEAANQREIAFAHFHQEAGNLPTLRVLGWDGSDTPLKLEYVDTTLQRTMRWPDDPNDHDAWREAWSQTFRHRLGHVIRTADALATALAELARQIRDAATLLLAHETESGPLRSLHKAFQTALIHDLSEADFADTYAQTITYGLLTAAISRTEMSDGQYGTALITDNVADIVPVTNPFLKEMLQTFLRAGGRRGGIDFDELGIQDVVELLRGDETDLPAILRDFGNKTKGEDPVIHFYEHFLAAYDKELKVKRGVFYTPKPVVSYIVRSVHELLQMEFGLEDGLADTTTWGEMSQRHPEMAIADGTDLDSPFVVILDPATGTATFLVEVIEVIHRTLIAKWHKAGLTKSQQHFAWNEYVPRHLLPRMYGYELMMAPYAIAHMKIGLKLHETGYRFGTEERVRVFLTNALEQASNFSGQFEFVVPALAHEAEAVDIVKLNQHFTIVIGNPPYAYESSNIGKWIQSLARDYYFIDEVSLEERNPKGLQDDYVKFIRFGQWKLSEVDIGILSFISNHSYIDSPTFRGMRWNLMRTFDHLYFLELQGSSKRSVVTPNGETDENVFDIQQGVAIGLFIKEKINAIEKKPYVFHKDVRGNRESKYSWLLTTSFKTTDWNQIEPKKPFYLFEPQDDTLQTEYSAGWKLTDIFRIYSVGVSTSRDKLSINWKEQDTIDIIHDFVDLSVDEARSKYDLGKDSRDWKVALAQQDLKKTQLDHSNIRPIFYRPFDHRYVYYSPNSRGFLSMPRPEVMQHMIAGENLGLCSNRQVNDHFRHAFVTQEIADGNAVSLASRERTYLFPLFLYNDLATAEPSLFSNTTQSRDMNFIATFVRAMEERLNVKVSDRSKSGADENTITPQEVFHYIYAILHAPSYRIRYVEFLRRDFPRIPLVGTRTLFSKLSQMGADLVSLHLFESDYSKASWVQQNKPTPWAESNTNLTVGTNGKTMGKFNRNTCYQDGRVFLDTSNLETSSHFDGILEDVWNFHVGGYQVLYKWLYDRRAIGNRSGRHLTDSDIRHYQSIVTALKETIRIMAEIDDVIEEHGGWPLQ